MCSRKRATKTKVLSKQNMPTVNTKIDCVSLERHVIELSSKYLFKSCKNLDSTKSQNAHKKA